MKKFFERTNADTGVAQFTDSLLKFGLYFLLAMIIARNLGVELSSLTALFAGAGVGVTMALQGTLSNFAGGVLILILKPFKVGDYIIEDTNKDEGTVKEAGNCRVEAEEPDEDDTEKIAQEGRDRTHNQKAQNGASKHGESGDGKALDKVAHARSEELLNLRSEIGREDDGDDRARIAQQDDGDAKEVHVDRSGEGRSLEQGVERLF